MRKRLAGNKSPGPGQILAAAIALVAISIWFYRKAFINAFFGDDLPLVYAGLDLAHWWDSFGLAVHAAMRRAFKIYYYRPFALLSERAYLAAFGMDLGLWRGVTVALHAINTLLVFTLLKRRVPGLAIPFLGALLWSVGHYKADAVMWMCCYILVAAETLLLVAVLVGDRKGGTGIVVTQVLLFAGAVAFHELSWVYAGVFVLQAVILRKAKLKELAMLCAGILLVAAVFFPIYLKVARLAPLPAWVPDFSGPPRNALPLLTALVVPFHIMMNKLNLALSPKLGFAVGWPQVLIPFWIAMATGFWLLLRSRPGLGKRLLNDRVFWFGLGWTLLFVLPDSLYGTWYHGRHAYMQTGGWVLTLARFFHHWRECSPGRRPGAGLLAVAVIMLASQVAFSVKVRAHMIRGYEEVPALVADMKASISPPRSGETWVVVKFPFQPEQVGAFARFAYGKARVPAVIATEADSVQMPSAPWRLFRYDPATVKLVLVETR